MILVNIIYNTVKFTITNCLIALQPNPNEKRAYYARPFLTLSCHSRLQKRNDLWEKVQESNSGFVTAKLNGKDWTGQIVTGYYNSRQKFGISIGQYTGDVATENLSINDIYFTKPANRIYDNITSGKKDSTMAYFFLTDDDLFSLLISLRKTAVGLTQYMLTSMTILQGLLSEDSILPYT